MQFYFLPFLKIFFRKKTLRLGGKPSFRFWFGRRGKEVPMRRTLRRLLEFVAIYALKRLIDWFFDKKD